MNFNYSNVFVTIATEKISASSDFYGHIFQQQPRIYRPETYVEFAINGLTLAIFKPKAEHSSEFANASSNMSLCIEVEDLEGAIAILTDLGYAPPGKIIEASHGQEIYAYDPTGTRLILHQGKKKESSQ